MRNRIHRRGGAGVFLLVILLLVAIVAVGTWRGWWYAAVDEKEAADQVEVELNVDRGRIRQDAKQLANRTRQATQSAAVASELRTVEGTIRQRSDDLLVVETEDQTFRFALTEATEFDGEPQEADYLETGQRVLVTYRQHEQGPVALQVKPAVAAHEP